ncbi:hypothetical protein EON63_16920 [archaeon]|nr:MAG: hypothetical protein EON63_16920 [archaeon]
MEITLTELKSVHYFDASSGGLTAELLSNQWIAKHEEKLLVTLLVDINFVVSAFHLHTSIYRLVHAYQHGHVKLANFHAELCYQLGGNKNIPQSIKLFSPSSNSVLVALINLELPITDQFVQSNDMSNISLDSQFSHIHASTASLGRQLEASQGFPDLSKGVLGDDRLQAIARFFKLNPVESRTGQVLEFSILMKVTMKDIL